MTTVTFNIDDAEVPLLKLILKKLGVQDIDFIDEKTLFEFLGDLNDKAMEELKMASKEIDNGDFVTHDKVELIFPVYGSKMEQKRLQ